MCYTFILTTRGVTRKRDILWPQFVKCRKTAVHSNLHSFIKTASASRRYVITQYFPILFFPKESLTTISSFAPGIVQEMSDRKKKLSISSLSSLLKLKLTDVFLSYSFYMDKPTSLTSPDSTALFFPVRMWELQTTAI